MFSTSLSFFLDSNRYLKNTIMCSSPINYSPPVFRKNDIAALKQLSNNKSVVVYKPDKGCRAVIVDKTKYLDSMRIIISDRIKFEPVNKSAMKYTFRIMSSYM